MKTVRVFVGKRGPHAYALQIIKAFINGAEAVEVEARGRFINSAVPAVFIAKQMVNFEIADVKSDAVFYEGQGGLKRLVPVLNIRLIRA